MHKHVTLLAAAALAIATLLAEFPTTAQDARPKGPATVHLVASNSLPISQGTQSHYALCPAGETAVGGGAVPVQADASTPQVDATLVASYPITTPIPPVGAPPAATDTANGWAGIITVGPSGASTFLRVYALCAAQGRTH